MSEPVCSAEPSEDESVRALSTAGIELVGRIIGSSNETFLVRLLRPGEASGGARELADERTGSFAGLLPRGAVHAVYKPELGERPLHDFPPGLFRRERAAHLLSEHLGMHLVPPTVIREDAPFGIGSLQLFRHHDPQEHYFSLFAAHGRPAGRAVPVVLEGFGDLVGLDVAEDTLDAVVLPGLLGESPDGGRDDAAQDSAAAAAASHRAVLEQLRRLALFDVLANNADRKAGHVLQGTDGRLWAIDHGLCFAQDLKLRTVIWDFAGEALDDGMLEDLWGLIEAVPAELTELLEPGEVRALQGRARWLAAVGELPADPTGMRLPWPLV